MFDDLQLTSQKYFTRGPSWVAQWPIEDTQSITLDADLVLATFSDGVIPTGTPIGRVTATGRYAPAVAGASNGTQTARGLLLADRKVRAGQHVQAALYYKGRVFRDFIKPLAGLTDAHVAQLEPQIVFNKVGG